MFIGGGAPQRARVKVRILPEVAPQDYDESQAGLGFRVLGVYAISVPIDILP